MLLLEAGLGPTCQLNQFLSLVRIADRNNKTAADLELRLQCRRDFQSAGSDQDGVEVAAVGPTLRSVAMFKFDIPVSELLKAFAGLRNRRRLPLDGADLSGDLRCNGRRVARPAPTSRTRSPGPISAASSIRATI
jgi:hypothetical protein